MHRLIRTAAAAALGLSALWLTTTVPAGATNPPPVCENNGREFTYNPSTTQCTPPTTGATTTGATTTAATTTTATTLPPTTTVPPTTTTVFNCGLCAGQFGTTTTTAQATTTVAPPVTTAPPTTQPAPPPPDTTPEHVTVPDAPATTAPPELPVTGSLSGPMVAWALAAGAVGLALVAFAKAVRRA